ncbi:Rsa3p NDAI_0E03430 [Naumovozyma dairenensis CBS 421]|uniref:Ribosome assembly protein 3 n=1 Tax=Naumovozyma dairenensis (strain ATCC 10597 / BCRC 20456 / CBS 421 / NBRC 0211 / NRRL Y-12639) TaxID=1071378 RepID=G0WBP0_NAUDC|nr:hypothetical protein NDAI_0E03430 [Naumovozyma dairenensis CBS 421]CCD25160.1 hypothetical protein NDAI_0E03430 [Naumovozyma dairenensis CBS 421]
MSAGDINVIKKNNNKKSRRRKKRRTADVSSDSDSSSSSSSSDNEEIITNDDNVENKDVIVSDVELSDNESSVPMKSEKAAEFLDDETKDRLNNIPFTTTDLTQRSNGQRNQEGTQVDLQKVEEAINDAKLKFSDAINERKSTINGNNTNAEKIENDLKNQYLGLLFENYGDDINELRTAPDFTTKSLTLLANVLKEGSGMFDVNTLQTILESK